MSVLDPATQEIADPNREIAGDSRPVNTKNTAKHQKPPKQQGPPTKSCWVQPALRSELQVSKRAYRMPAGREVCFKSSDIGGADEPWCSTCTVITRLHDPELEREDDLEKHYEWH